MMAVGAARIVCAIACLCFVHPSRAETLHSQYTALQNCETLSRLKLPGRTIERGEGAGVFRCAGLDGFSVYVVEEDPRSFLALERGGRFFSLEQSMIGAFDLGCFPNVSGAKKAEWRLDPSGRVVGLIVRVAYLQKEPPGGPASALLAFDLRAEPRLIGHAKTNEEARRLMDGVVEKADGAGDAK